MPACTSQTDAPWPMCMTLCMCVCVCTHRRYVDGSGFAIFVGALAFLASTTFMVLMFLGHRVRFKLSQERGGDVACSAAKQPPANPSCSTTSSLSLTHTYTHARTLSVRLCGQVGRMADYQQLVTFIFGALWVLLYIIAGIVMAAPRTQAPPRSHEAAEIDA
jgi:hypothetical protein